MAEQHQVVSDREAAVNRARAVLGGQALDPPGMRELARRLKNFDEFGYARKLFERARNAQDAAWNDQERLALAQQLALTTYKDPDLPADQKYARALEVLRKECNLGSSTDRETLGLAGAIYKRRWEVEGQRQFLERSCHYYLKACHQGMPAATDHNPGYNEINAAFLLDLLADLEARAIGDDGDQLESVRLRRATARRLRESIIEHLATAAAAGGPLAADYWVLATLAEAAFGLGRYEEARQWLERAFDRPDLPSWQIFSTTSQLVRLTGLMGDADRAAEGLRLLGELLERAGVPRSSEAVSDLLSGKVGLALSGGGFRAALFHIGVLAKLADIGVLNRVEVLSCVSGGSIIGAHYYLELRRLYAIDRKTDTDLTRADYVEIVKNLEREFLAGVRKNIRTRVISSLTSNLKMIFSRDYSRTMRVGELYEKHLYARVEDREGQEPRWLDELKITPVDESRSFNPRRDNWRRRNKIPILILNATALNTGHVWQFTASYMGEPPAAINTEIDAGYRLRRMYYPDAPLAYRNDEGAGRRIRLGHAVASSSCVPGMFEPLALPGLYPGKTVQLVDGGVFDNQGAASLLEQECSVVLVSDASGQMTTEDYPATGILGVVSRASSISQERIRWTQYRELDARRRAGQLKDLMFIHLKKDLDTDPADWVDCPDPYDSTSDARPPELRGPLTRYGVRKDLQRLLAAVRTDLDSFSDGEAYALMASGYLMTEHQFAQSRGSFPDVRDEDLRHRGSWLFLDYEETLTKPGFGERLKRLLEVSSQTVFKIWRLSRPLHLGVEFLKTVLLGGFIWLIFWYFKNPARIPTDLFERPLLKLTLGAAKGPYTLKLGWVLVTVLTLLLGKVFGDRVMKVASWPETLRKAATGLAAATVGSGLAWLHLLIFDRLYLRWGRTHRLINLRKKR